MRLAFSGTRLESDPLRRVDVDSVDVKHPVEMRAGGASGGTGVAEDVAALDLQAWRGDESGHVEVHGLEALPVVYADGVAQDVKLLSERDPASGYRADGFARGSTLVDAAVVFAGGLAVVEALHAEGRGHTAGDGSGERVLPEAGVRDFYFEGVQQRHFFGRGVERFDFGAELDVLGGEDGFADGDGELLRLGPAFTNEHQRRRAGSVFDRDGKQAKALAVGLQEEFGGAAIKRDLSEVWWTDDA